MAFAKYTAKPLAFAEEDICEDLKPEKAFPSICCKTNKFCKTPPTRILERISYECTVSPQNVAPASLRSLLRKRSPFHYPT